MKTKRIINAAFWSTMAIIVCVATCIHWHNIGCGLESLIAAIVFYTACPAAMAIAIDAAIQGK